MADESYVAVVLGELAEAAEAMSAEAIERDADEDDEDVLPYEVDWASGVEHFQDKTPEEMWAHLGLEDRIPGLNDQQDPNGLVDPWTAGSAWNNLVESNKVVPLFPFWHQVVGIAQLMHQVIRGRPTLLMDGVGVGKTLELVGVIALYAQYYEFFKKNKRFPGAYGTSVLFFPTRILLTQRSGDEVRNAQQEPARQAAPHHCAGSPPHAVDAGAASVPAIRRVRRDAVHARIQRGNSGVVLEAGQRGSGRPSAMSAHRSRFDRGKSRAMLCRVEFF